jgi:CO/xanthine dehydrogenase Mo-binding subunit
MHQESVIGKSLTNIEGIEKLTGQARYVPDLVLPGMLVGKFLYSEYPRARIRRLDTSAAEAIPGVEAVVTHCDLTSEKVYGWLVKDQPIFAGDEVFCLSDIVAAVAAVDEDVAERAIQAIEVDYEPLPGILNPVDALKDGAPLARTDLENNVLIHHPIHHGDVDKGFAEADVIVEREYRTQFMDQVFLETEGALVDWDGDILTVYAGGQYAHRDQLHIAEALGLPANRVRVIYPHIGGAFGGKDELHVQIPVAMLAMKSNRPVKLIRTRSESLLCRGKRGPMLVRYKTGATKEGKLTAIEVEIVGDSGPYTSLSTAVMGFACEMSSGPYDVPNAKIDGYSVATNNILVGCMRGFGCPEVAFAGEQNMDLVAQELGMDPLEFRLKNGMQKGTTMAPGSHIYYEIGLKETMRQASEATDWSNRESWLDREPAPHLRRGLGIASIWHGMGIGRNLVDHTAMNLEMAPDGSVTVFTGLADIGQGGHTVHAMMAAEALGIQPEDVRVAPVDTQGSPDGGTTTASRAAYMGGRAILEAAKPIRQTLLELAAEKTEIPLEVLSLRKRHVYADEEKLNLTVAELAMMAWNRNKRLQGQGFVSMWHPEKPVVPFNYPIPHSIFLYATHIAQVLVDTETGQVKVEKLWAAHDVGHSVNPLGIEGQVDGGVVQGVGYALMEELRIERGRLTNPSLESYVLPRATDIPEVEYIIVEVPEPSGPYGVKGVGEATLNPVAAAIANAVADATGVRTYEIPMTPERVLDALESK